MELYRIAAEKLAKMELAASKKSLRFENRIEPSATAFADREMVTIIFRNLLTNAIKFTPAGGTIRLESRLADDFWVISITDSGVGMSPQRFDNLFSSNISTLEIPAGKRTYISQ